MMLRYALWFTGLNLAWEVSQLPLYTIWDEAQASYIAFAVLHCTAGDLLIGVSALALALVLTRARPPDRYNWPAVAALLTIIGVGYTAFSEWNNTVLRPAWAYSELMPIIPIGNAAIGLSPLLQWLLLPPLALWLARPR
jgi:hypothetical protein